MKYPLHHLIDLVINIKEKYPSFLFYFILFCTMGQRLLVVERERAVYPHQFAFQSMNLPIIFLISPSFFVNECAQSRTALRLDFLASFWRHGLESWEP